MEHIRNFKLLPQASLAQLKQSLGLKMSIAELAFCAKHYTADPTGEISIDALQWIDALACPARTELCKIAVGEMQTDSEACAQAFADAIAKLKELGRDPEKPYTLQDLADLPARYLSALHPGAQAEPVGIDGTNAYYAAKGLAARARLQSPTRHFDLLQALLPSLDTHAAYTDTLMLLCPGEGMDDLTFDAELPLLLRESDASAQLHCICDCGTQSIAHAILHISSGAVINLARLPEGLQSAQALTRCFTGLLLALPQEAAWTLQAQAVARGMQACCFGVADHAGHLIIRNQKDLVFSLHIPYLRSICFIRSYTLRPEDAAYAVQSAYTSELPLRAPQEALTEQEEEEEPTEQLLVRTLPPLRAHNATQAASTSYQATLKCAVLAHCAAVAAGSDPQAVRLRVRLAQNGTRSAASSALLSGLLGLHRFAMELGVPVDTDGELQAQHAGTTVLASAPSDLVLPGTLQGGGRIYLLQATRNADGSPDFDELRTLISYLRRAMLAGKISAARAFADASADDVLLKMAHDVQLLPNPHAVQLAKQNCTYGFLVEATEPLEGDLIALSAPKILANSL